MNQICSKLFTSNTLYVLINIYVSAMGFIRSIVFMKNLNMSDLGIISLVQTVMLFLGLFQIGLLNGGYRIFALNKTEQQTEINNLLFSYIILLSGIAFIFWGILVITKTTLTMSNDIMLLALICGILTLTQNWLTNTLIAKRLIKDINKINIISSTIALISLPLVWIWGVFGAISVLFAQPFLFIALTLIKRKELRPSSWNFNLKLIRYVLSFGFIPFLSGICTIIILQIERWSIADILGTAALGEFYLVFLYTTLFSLIPTSILNLFFPKSVYSYETGNLYEFKRILKLHLLLLTIYLISATVLTLWLLQPVVDLILPKHSANTIYVYYFLPGAISQVLCHSFSLISAATVRLRPYLITGFSSIVMMIIFIIGAVKLNMFTLINIAIAKSIIESFIFLYYVGYVCIHRKAIFLQINIPH